MILRCGIVCNGSYKGQLSSQTIEREFPHFVDISIPLGASGL